MVSTTTDQTWKNRIVGSGTIRADALVPNERNWRSHGAGQQAALGSVLEEVGWVQQIVVNVRSSEAWGEQRGRQTLIDGHLRRELGLRQGGETELPVTYVDLDPDQERLVLASFDPIGAMATADRQRLSELLEGIQNPDLAELLEAVARANRIALDLGSPGLTDPDDVPEPPEKPISKPGDLWLLGAHKLLCGDATKAEDVSRLMAGERAVLMPTDPPFGVSYDGGNRPSTWAKDGRRISSEEKTRHWDDYEEAGALLSFYEQFLKVALECALTDVPVIYQWFAMTKADVVMKAWRANGLLPHQVVIWHKSRSVLGRSDFCYDYEPAMYGWVQGKRPEPERRPPANACAVWQIPSAIEDGASGIHPTQKVCELIRRPIEWHTLPNGLVYEPFSGSGTCVVAAEMTGRRCLAMELSPVFVDVAVERWRRFTGQEPKLANQDK
jgi:DNA modification methylase